MCIDRVFGYKACGNHTFLNISQMLKITEKERNELLLSVKNLHELGFSPFPYIAPVIPRPLPREVVKGEHFVFADILKSISSSTSQARFAREPQAEIAKGALVSFAQLNQSPLGEQGSQLAPQAVKRKKAKKVGQIQAASSRLEGFMDLVDPISNEPNKGRKDDMSNLAVRFVAWMHP